MDKRSSGAYAPTHAEDDARPRANAVLARAVALHLDRKPAEAIRELEQAVTAGERDALVLAALAHLHGEMRNYAESVSCYLRLLEVEPAHPDARYNLAVSLGKLGKWDQAAAAFRDAAESDLRNAESHLGLGTCLVRLGRPGEALDSFNRYLLQYPDNEPALFAKAVALHQLKRFGEAADFYKRALAISEKRSARP